MSSPKIIITKQEEKAIRKEQEDISRQGIRHEDELISKRLTWMTTIHGFLFSALGFSFGKYLSLWFYLIIGFTGIFISFSTSVTLREAMKAIDIYVDRWKNPIKYMNSLSPQGMIIGFVREDHDHKVIQTFSRLSPPALLPRIFGYGWCTILICSILGVLDPTIERNLFKALESKTNTIQIQIREPSTIHISRTKPSLNKFPISQDSVILPSRNKSKVNIKSH